MNPILNCELQNIHPSTQFGKNVTIEAKSIIIEENCIIKDNTKIKCLGAFKLGKFSILGIDTKISCNNFICGEWLYTTEGFEVGRGGCFGPESNVTIGNNVGIFERTVINPNSEVTIGDNTGIGSEVMIWTHGAWLDVFQGFPAEFGPVHIGKNVWLPARSIVLPNVTLGDNSVIGINSLINKNIPDGAFAAGIPIKIIKENVYPKILTDEQKINIINDILIDWKKLIIFKIKDDANNIYIKLNQFTIELIYKDQKTYYDTIKLITTGDINLISEDLRDYLRRRGIKIYTNHFFQSI